MEPQLHLITSDEGTRGGRRPKSWKLDRRTVETGRAGIEAARAALEAARRRHPSSGSDDRRSAA